MAFPLGLSASRITRSRKCITSAKQLHIYQRAWLVRFEDKLHWLVARKQLRGGRLRRRSSCDISNPFANLCPPSCKDGEEGAC